MNPLIREQLKKIRLTHLPEYDDNTTHIVISRRTTPVKGGLVEGKCYLIQVEDYIVHPFDGFNLHDNWNKGIPPKHCFMKVEVGKIMGKMVKVNSVGYDFKNKLDTNDVWEGWLPEKSITVIEEI